MITTASRPLAAAPARSLLDLSFRDLEAALVADGVPAIHARPLWRALYRALDSELVSREHFPPPLQRWLGAVLGPGGSFAVERLELADSTESSEGRAQKVLLRLAEGQSVETVLMDYPGRATLCVSTQAGCAMGCVFCATGQMGFVRHLRPAEIIAQVVHGQRLLRERGSPGLRNLVLMGMGEPLHNYDAVMAALETVTHARGLALGPSRISISTVGVIPGILRMAREQSPYHLAVSLHAATEEERAALVPASKRWPLAELIAACRFYCDETGRRIFFAWTLIAGQNDSPAQAAQLAGLLAGINAHVNLIPLNRTDGFAGNSTTPETVAAFQDVLRRAGVPSTVRQRRGIDVAAGCGQLRAARKTRMETAPAP